MRVPCLLGLDLGGGGEDGEVLRCGKGSQLYELKGQNVSIRGISSRLGISRNTTRKYLRAQELPQAKPRPRRGSKLDPFKDYICQRMAEGVTNCVVLLRELNERGYDGHYSTVKHYVQPLRKVAQPRATMRFETEPGEQAQVDFGGVKYGAVDGTKRHFWVFVMVLGWSRMLYVELLTRADLPSFIRCHINAFEALGGVPRTCLYDNCKVAVVGRDEAGRPIFNPQLLDFSLRLGFGLKACYPYRPQTKGKVESGIKYMKGNFWPSARFTDLDDLNRLAREWCDKVANVRIHGTTGECPAARWEEERGQLGPLVSQERLLPFLRERCLVGRDGFVKYQLGSYGVSCKWAGRMVEVQSGEHCVELWAGDQRLAVHAKAWKRGQRFPAPGQWEGLPRGESNRRKEVLAVQLPTIEVQQRCLGVYDQLVGREVDR